MSDNKAVVVKLTNVRKHPNADRLQLATVSGFQVIVGMDAKEGDVGLFFDANLQLSKEFAEANDLITRFEDEVQSDGSIKQVRKGGFFDPKNRRVRPQTFRGEKSYGFWCPIECLWQTTGDDTHLNLGDMIDEVDGVPICNKYVLPMQGSANTSKKTSKRGKVVAAMFKEHQDTKQIRYYMDEIAKPGNFITITSKMHGTSGRYGNVLVHRKLSWFERMLAKWGFNIKDTEWKHLHGSRRVIIGEDDNGGFYHTNTFREKVMEGISLHKGETIYYEIVGWVAENSPIMGQADLNKKDVQELLGKDVAKQLRERYGDSFHWKYGQPNGTAKAFVYHITQTNEDGITFNLSWDAVKERCYELGLEHVRELEVTEEFESHYGTKEVLYETVKLYTEGEIDDDPDNEWPNDYIDYSHPLEGIVLRVDCGGVTRFYKDKTWIFYALESIDKGRPNMEDADGL